MRDRFVIPTTCVLLAGFVSACGGPTGVRVSISRSGTTALGSADPAGLPTLRVSCEIVDRHGAAMPCDPTLDGGNGWEIERPLGVGYRVVLRAECQEPVEIPLQALDVVFAPGSGGQSATLAANWTFAPPVDARVGRALDAVRVSDGSVRPLAVGTRVERIALWPDATGRCDDAIVLVVGDESVAYYRVPRSAVVVLTDEERDAEEDDVARRERETAGAAEAQRLVVADRARAADERARGAASEAAERIAAAEASSGACNAEHLAAVAALRTRLDAVLFEQHLQPTWAEAGVCTSGTEHLWNLRARRNGVQHVFVIAWQPSAIAVEGAVRFASPLRPSSWHANVEARVVGPTRTLASGSFRANAGDAYEISVEASGCFIVATYWAIPVDLW